MLAMKVFHSVNHLVRERVTQTPDRIALGVPDNLLKYKKYTFKELDVAASLLAKHYVDSNLLERRAKGDYTTHRVVGLLAQSGFDYLVNELALSRLGYCILLISPNNSAPAVRHLLEITHAKSVVASEALLHVAYSALSDQVDAESPKIIAQPSSEVYSPSVCQANWDIHWEYPLEFEQEGDLPFVIIHSSGSTGYPKPISITHRAGVHNYSQHLGYRPFTTLPLYHNHGHSNMYRTFHSGQPIYQFSAGVLPMTAGNILSLLENPDCDADAIYAVPLVLKFLAESEQGVDLLKKMKVVMIAGSALSEEIGDKIVSCGVNLLQQMGTTEVGQIGTSMRDFKADKEWNYIRIPQHLRRFFHFDDQGDGAYELVVLDGYPTKVISNQPDGSYRTRDLYRFHPTLEWAIKFCGRLDDTLVMINGEKTNPVPMELCLQGESPYISDAIIFGTGRPQIGVLILVSELGKDKSEEELKKLISPTLAKANADAPSHSQLAPEAMIFLPYGTSIPRTDKSSFIRSRTYAMFQKTIDNFYKELEGNVDTGILKKQIRTLQDGLDFIHGIMKEILGEKAETLRNNTDLFSFGLDSLQAMRIRNAVRRNIDIGTHNLPSNFVFDNPSVNAIVQYLIALNTGGSEQVAVSSQVNIMLNMVEKYRTFASEVQRPLGKGSSSSGICVLLTGATGSLGSHLLEEFLMDQAISRVYCLCRASSHDIAEKRISESMVTRGLTRNFQSKQDKVISLAANFSEECLGLSAAEYQELQDNVTLIIHCAWPVNFNLGISSFAPHIAGAVNLMKLALEARHADPAEFYFCSSVSTVFAWPGPGLVPEQITDNPKFAQHMGYARSKWVVEKICQIASETSALKAQVLRIGQLVGSSQTGIWNESEAVSLMFKSAQTTSTLPILDEFVAWLPVDAAARIICEIVSFSQKDCSHDSFCWHVVQPKQVHWSEILDHLEAAGLKFERVARRQWLDGLRNSDPDPTRNPTIKLMSFYEEKYGSENLPIRFGWNTEKTEAASQKMRHAPYPDSDLVKRWVDNWKRTSFFQ